MRTQLQDEIQQLRGREEENQGENEDIKDKEDEKTKEVEMGKGIWKRDHIGKNWETEVTVLQADLVKVGLTDHSLSQHALYTSLCIYCSFTSGSKSVQN